MGALILVADADPFNLRLLQEMCEAGGYRVVTSGEGGEVLDVVARERPDLILLDQGIPGLDGFEVLRILKSDAVLSQVPVLFVTGPGDVDARRHAIERGAEDYLTKPYLVFEVQQRLRNALRAKRGEADRDRGETQIGTPQQLGISLEYEFTRAARYGHELACLVLRVTDHERLDEEQEPGWREVLGRVLRSCVRGADQVYASDADEFTLLLPETGGEGARIVFERIQALFRRGETELRPSLHGAYAVHPHDGGEGGLELLAAARRAFKGS